MSVLAKAASVVSAKGAVGIAVALLAVGAAGAAAEAAVTGSTDPNVWGQQVVQQVNKCKAALTDGQHGIGQCVSAFAKTHGPQVSAEHRASNARTNDHTPGPPSGKGKPSGLPSPGGKPNGVPPTHSS